MFVFSLFCVVTVEGLHAESEVSDELVELNTVAPEKMALLGNLFFNIMTGQLFNYLRDSFKMYQDQHPVAAGLFGSYIQGKHISSDINKTNSLHHAMVAGDLNVAQLLLFLGANPNYKITGGMSALEEAQQLKLSSFESLFQKYDYEPVQFIGRTDLKPVWYKKALTRVVDVVAPLTAEQGVHSLVQIFEMYGKQHPWLLKFFFYGISGYRLDLVMNKPWYRHNFLQYCISDENADLANLLLYLGADPLQDNSHGQCALATALYNFKVPFVNLFWWYVSASAIKSKMLPKLEKYKVLLLIAAIRDYQETRSTVLLSDVALYFNAITQPINKLFPSAQIIDLLETINALSWDMYHVRPFEISSKEIRALSLVMRDQKMIVIPQKYEIINP